MRNKLELAANVAVIFACAVFVYSTLTERLRSVDAPDMIHQPINQSLLGLSRGSQAIVLGLSTKCPYCTKSGGFYKRLADAARREHVTVVAVFPQSVDEGRSYLSKLDVPIENVRSSSLADIHVRGTPTILFLDGNGRITNGWIGLLPPEREAEVLSAMVPRLQRLSRSVQQLFH